MTAGREDTTRTLKKFYPPTMQRQAKLSVFSILLALVGFILVANFSTSVTNKGVRRRTEAEQVQVQAQRNDQSDVQSLTNDIKDVEQNTVQLNQIKDMAKVQLANEVLNYGDTSIASGEIINNTESNTTVLASDDDESELDASVLNTAKDVEESEPHNSIQPPQAIADAILSFIYSEDGVIGLQEIDNCEEAGISHLFVKHLAKLAYKEVMANGGDKSRIIEDMYKLRQIKIPYSKEILPFPRERALNAHKGLRKSKADHIALSTAIMIAVHAYDGDMNVGTLHNLLSSAVDGVLNQ